ncbi:metallophosphoesterase [Loktanella agnita]|uniref:metallophosphoesterase n=1 Tax=Loktanella agnita TaxID=287097 RepID=UPI003986C862
MTLIDTTTSTIFSGNPPAPAQPFFAVGDVHGRLDLLEPVINRLGEARHPIILVGDYIDRGPDSAGVLRYLQQQSATGQVICLRGNHEDMLLKFLDRPRKHGRVWLRFGGVQTLESFGITGVTAQSEPGALIAARDALLAALGDTRDWLSTLPYAWQSGNVAVVHAGANPHQPLETQSQPALAWGHPDFRHVARSDGLWLIHGHTIVAAPHIVDGRVAIDTGAYATGQLTAVHVTAGAISPV